jgi:hypothetical protein
MPLPVAEKTYQYVGGIDLGPSNDGADRMADVVLAIVNLWLAIPIKPWKVMGSCDSVAAGMDRVNRWAAANDIVWTADNNPNSVAPRSWIVLQNAGGLQLLLHCVHTSTYLGFWLSRAGFTGGSPTARPTASDEVFFGGTDPTTNPWVLWATDLDSGAGVVNRAHVLHSTDGRCTCMFFTGLGAGSVGGVSQEGQGYEGAWIIGELGDAPRSVVKPFFGLIDTVGITGAMYDNTFDSQVGCFLPSGPARATIAVEHGYQLSPTGGAASVGVASSLNAPNDISGEWPVQPMRVYHATTGAWVGRIKDVYLAAGASPGGLVSGTRFPKTGAQKWAQFGPFLVPLEVAPVVGRDELSYVSRSPSTSSYGLPNPSPWASSGFTGAITLTFSDVLDPDSIVLDYKRQNTVPAMSAFNPASTFRLWIKAPGGPPLVPTIEVIGKTIKIHNTGDGPADTWETPGGNVLQMKVYMTAESRTAAAWR